MFSTKPFSSILDLIRTFPDEQSCIKHLEILRWNGNVISPFDESSKVYVCSKGRYKCKNSGKYFNVKTGTIFEDTKIPLQQWFLAIYLLSSHKKGLSSYQLARDLDITQKSAWFMIQRISYAMNHSAFTSYMEGIVEVDETFVGGKNKNRHADKKVKNSQGRSFKDKTPVLGMLNREGSLKCVVIPDTTGDNIQPILRQHISDGSIVMTDEWKAYNGLNNAYEHQIVDHGRKQYVNESGATTNRIENAWSNFKKSIIGIHHNNLSRKHLQQYTNAFTFRFNTRNYMTDDRFNLLLIDLKGKRLTYKNLITQ